jgi:hypothetical protein
VVTLFPVSPAPDMRYERRNLRTGCEPRCCCVLTDSSQLECLKASRTQQKRVGCQRSRRSV